MDIPAGVRAVEARIAQIMGPESAAFGNFREGAAFGAYLSSALESRWPSDGPVTSPFGLRKNPMGAGYEFHPGIDIGAELGAPIRAVASGRVIAAGPQGGYGNVVVVDQGNGLTSRYAHCSQLLATVGDAVNAGDELATVGSTGHSNGPHLHFEIRENGRAIDPRPFLTKG